MDPKTEVHLPKTQESSLQDRVRKVTDGIVVAAVDHFTGKKTCHRFMIPADYITPDPLDPRAAKLNLQLGHVPCIGAKCALWNAEALECFDVTEKRAAKSTADILDLIDGHARMIHEK